MSVRWSSPISSPAASANPVDSAAEASRCRLRLAHGALEQPLALALGEPLRAQADPARDLLGQAAERHHRTEQRPVGHELAGVMLGVGRGGHDEQRAPRRGRGVGAEDFAGLGRVGRSEHEGQGHRHMVARGPDGIGSAGSSLGRAARHGAGTTAREPARRGREPLRCGLGAAGAADRPDSPGPQVPIRAAPARPDGNMRLDAGSRATQSPAQSRSTCAASPERERGPTCPRLAARWPSARGRGIRGLLRPRQPRPPGLV